MWKIFKNHMSSIFKEELISCIGCAYGLLTLVDLNRIKIFKYDGTLHFEKPYDKLYQVIDLFDHRPANKEPQFFYKSIPFTTIVCTNLLAIVLDINFLVPRRFSCRFSSSSLEALKPELMMLIFIIFLLYPANQAEWRPAPSGVYPDHPPSPRARKLEGKVEPAKKDSASTGRFGFSGPAPLLIVAS